MKIEEIKKAIANLSDEERTQLFQEMNLEQQRKVLIQIEFDDRSDIGKNAPSILCTYPDGKAQKIFIYDEIKKDPCKLADPLIQLCIYRWKNITQYKHLVTKDDYSIAKNHLEQLGVKLIKGIETSVIPKEIAYLVDVSPLEFEYIKKIWDITRRQEITLLCQVRRNDKMAKEVKK